jgi:PAS domain S-box-containing protein
MSKLSSRNNKNQDQSPDGPFCAKPNQHINLDTDNLELKHVIALLPHGLRIIDLNNNIKYVNKAYSALSGTSADDSIGKKCWEVFPDSLCQTSKCCFERIKNGEEYIENESQRFLPDGTSIPCLLTAFPLYSSGGTIIGIIQSFSDLTEKRTLEDAHRKLNEQFANRIQFTRALVHELKTFLTPLMSASELLGQHTKGEILNSLASTIDSAIAGLSHRVDELLDLAKGEIGRLEVQRIYFHPDELIKKVASCAQTIANTNNQEFECLILSKLPRLWADEERVTQILMNLLNNAFKYTPGGGKVKLSVWADKKCFYAEVADNGPGISAEDLPQLFSSYQLRVAERRVSSLGIGLPLAKMLSELHNGKISVKSEKDAGSTFTMSLPLTINGKMSSCNEDFNN